VREVVLDASMAVDLLLGRVTSRTEDAMTHAVLVAPAHVDAEILSALARLHRAGKLSDAEVDQALADLAAMPLQRLPIDGLLLSDAWAMRGNVSIKDALYLATAHRLRGRMLTTDQRLHRAAPGLTIGPSELN
jgi:predicted nucleic acid-binding protein